jgi:hypothetical protein
VKLSQIYALSIRLHLNTIIYCSLTCRKLFEHISMEHHKDKKIRLFLDSLFCKATAYQDSCPLAKSMSFQNRSKLALPQNHVFSKGETHLCSEEINRA